MTKLIPLLKISLLCCMDAPAVDRLRPGTAGGGSDSQVWIDVPLNGLTFEPGQAVNIEGHASGRAEHRLKSGSMPAW